MKKSLVVLALVGMVLLVCSTSFAATSYVVTNDDNCIATSNTSSIYTLNTTSGSLALYKTLTTGGLGNCGGFFATVGNGITQNAKCLFVMDGGTNDIAAFTVPALAKVGNYSNAAVMAGYPGGSMAITPNSKSLYATYAGTENIGAWSIGTGCTLTFIAAYQASFGADTYSNLIVDPTGAGLIVSVDDLGALEAFAIQANGSLTDLGSAEPQQHRLRTKRWLLPRGTRYQQEGISGRGQLDFRRFGVHHSVASYVTLFHQRHLCSAAQQRSVWSTMKFHGWTRPLIRPAPAMCTGAFLASVRDTRRACCRAVWRVE